MSEQCINRLSMQVCDACGRVQYPVREICRRCLSDELVVKPVTASGTALSTTRLHISLAPEPDQEMPMSLATVQLDCGATAITVAGPDVEPGCSVCVSQINNRLLAERTINNEEDA